MTDPNPYASPAEPDGLLNFDMGIGVWRDGSHLVMHEAAVLPAICVKSGVPTKLGACVELFRFELSSAPVKVRVPLAGWWRIVAVWCRRHVLLMAVAVMFPAILLSQALNKATGLAWDLPIMIAGGALFLLLVIFGLAFGSPLDCVRSEGPYLWLRGACRPLLDHFTEWDP